MTHLKAMEQKYAGVVEELEKMAQEFSKPSEDAAAGQVIPGLLDPKDGRNFLLVLQVFLSPSPWASNILQRAPRLQMKRPAAAAALEPLVLLLLLLLLL